MALQSQILKVKSVKILQMEHQNAENVAPAIVMDVIAENATPTATVTTRKIYKPIKLRKMFKLKKTHQQRALTFTVPQAPLHPWTERPKRRQLHPQRQSQSQYQSPRQLRRHLQACPRFKPTNCPWQVWYKSPKAQVYSGSTLIQKKLHKSKLPSQPNPKPCMSLAFDRLQWLLTKDLWSWWKLAKT
jgi:hypothetical protein